MKTSAAVRRYYAEQIFAKSGPDGIPAPFRPLGVPHTGRATVEGCRGGGKNILEVRLAVHAERVAAVHMSCNLCNPAMMVAASIIGLWAPGVALSDLLALDPESADDAAPWFDVLGTPDAADASEKFAYTLQALQEAVQDHLARESADEAAPPSQSMAE